MHFIFVAKPGDHKSMFEDIDGLKSIDGLESLVIEEGGYKYCYEGVNNVALNGSKHTKIVNYFSYM
jgi:hypothetical protein